MPGRTNKLLPTAFFINLDRDHVRRSSIEGELAATGFSAERIAAVDGRTLPDWAFAYLQHAPLRPGEIGCYASHLLSWRTIVERQLPYAIVLEDDTKIDDDALETIQAVIKALPEDWDYVHLFQRNSPRAPVFRPLVALGYGRNLVRFARVPVGAVAYLISANGARKLLAMKPRTLPIDCDVRMPWIWDLDVYGVSPAPFHHGDFESSIQAQGGFVNGKRGKQRGMRTLSAFTYNVSKLGIYWWIRCWLQDAVQKLQASRHPRRL